MLFIFSTPEFIKLKTAVFLHWYLICAVPLHLKVLLTFVYFTFVTSVINLTYSKQPVLLYAYVNAAFDRTGVLPKMISIYLTWLHFRKFCPRLNFLQPFLLFFNNKKWNKHVAMVWTYFLRMAVTSILV